MFCPKCGNRLTKGAKFCNKCGSPMSAQPENQASAAENVSETKSLEFDGDGSQEENGKSLALKGIRSDFKTGESIKFYINGSNALEGQENLLANKLRIFCLPHRDAKDYLIMSADNVAAISAFSDYYQDSPFGGWNFENSVNNDDQNRFLPGIYDILFYYEDTLAYYVMINIA